MSLSFIAKCLLFVFIGWGAWNWYLDRPVHAGPGILAPLEPLQGDVTGAENVQSGRWTLVPRASYDITARILGVARYRFDFLAALIPEDLALGWGPMSDSRVLAHLDISQSNRFYYWRAAVPLPVAKDVIVSHSANTHVIPSDPLVARQLSRLRPGQVVELKGVLVDARRDDGAWVRTSLIRTDSGAGACEVLLVREVAVVN